MQVQRVFSFAAAQYGCPNAIAISPAGGGRDLNWNMNAMLSTQSASHMMHFPASAAGALTTSASSHRSTPVYCRRRGSRPVACSVAAMTRASAGCRCTRYSCLYFAVYVQIASGAWLDMAWAAMNWQTYM